ncbi:unnamed protein product [Allacma fusca]|uniref:Uncharacterized protein n=1 Tax=Allacma fusca TaxID=39272 RepID=A0A8J2JZU5_9HEXA|nr:unnamed protein product [Allacma fusca]
MESAGFSEMEILSDKIMDDSQFWDDNNNPSWTFLWCARRRLEYLFVGKFLTASIGRDGSSLAHGGFLYNYMYVHEYVRVFG